MPMRRATVLVPSGPRHDPDRLHLHVLLTNPVGERQEVLLVGIQTRRRHCPDPTCILYPRDHPFIRQESFVSYGRAMIERAKTLSEGVHRGRLIPRDPMDGEVFARILAGINESRHVTPRVLRFYDES